MTDNTLSVYRCPECGNRIKVNHTGEIEDMTCTGMEWYAEEHDPVNMHKMGTAYTVIE